MPISPKNLEVTRFNTFRLPGKFSNFYEPNSLDSLQELISNLDEFPLLIGRGSNLLIGSRPIETPVFKLGEGFDFIKASNLDPEHARLPAGDSETDRSDEPNLQTNGPVVYSVGAAHGLMNLSRTACSQGLSGLEFGAGIPASIGGAIRMNAGAHGRSISGNSCLSYRKATQPLEMPSAGSVFRNPKTDIKIPRQDGKEFGGTAGELLEFLDCKGRRKGNVCVSDKHANWIVKSADPASGEEVRDLILELQSITKAETGVDLETEIIFWSLQ